jgi:hypothetical protein
MVQVGDDLYFRFVSGPDASWLRALRNRGSGRGVVRQCRAGRPLRGRRRQIGKPDRRHLPSEVRCRQPKYGNGTTAQFIALAEKVSGTDLTPLFQAWLSTPSKPALSSAAVSLGRLAAPKSPAQIRSTQALLKH